MNVEEDILKSPEDIENMMCHTLAFQVIAAANHIDQPRVLDGATRHMTLEEITALSKAMQKEAGVENLTKQVQDLVSLLYFRFKFIPGGKVEYSIDEISDDETEELLQHEIMLGLTAEEWGELQSAKSGLEFDSKHPSVGNSTLSARKRWETTKLKLQQEVQKYEEMQARYKQQNNLGDKVFPEWEKVQSELEAKRFANYEKREKNWKRKIRRQAVQTREAMKQKERTGNDWKSYSLVARAVQEKIKIEKEQMLKEAKIQKAQMEKAFDEKLKEAKDVARGEFAEALAKEKEIVASKEKVISEKDDVITIICQANKEKDRELKDLREQLDAQINALIEIVERSNKRQRRNAI